MSLIGPITQAVAFKQFGSWDRPKTQLNSHRDEDGKPNEPNFVFKLSSNFLNSKLFSNTSGLAKVEVDFYSEAESHWSFEFVKNSVYIPVLLSHVLINEDTVMFRLSGTHVKTEGMELEDQRVMVYLPLEWAQAHEELSRYIIPDAKFILRVTVLEEIIQIPVPVDPA